MAALALVAGCAAAPVATPTAAVPSVTGSAREVQRITNEPINQFYPRPSPDGKQILFHRRDDTRTGDERFSIAMVTVGSTGQVLVSERNASSPSWYPNGRSFAYVDSRSTQLRIVRSEIGSAGAGMTFLTSSATGDEDAPDVSPDGKKIAFASTIGGAKYIASIEAGNSNQTVFGPGSYPRWSPDGSKILFHRAVGDASQLFVLSLSSGQVTQMTTGPAGNYWGSWSPDGQWVVYTSSLTEDQRHVYMMKADGSNKTQLTRGDTEEGAAAWSKDGWIYFASNAGGYFNIWRLQPILP